MNILVCLKQTFDTEERIVLENGHVKEDGVRFVINPYDEYAVEEALRIKEEHDGQVTLVSVGPTRFEEAIRTALAMGADEAVLGDDPALFGDEFTISKVLAAIISQRPYDLILAGNQAVDDGSGQVSVRLAEELGIPHISMATKVEVEGNKVTVHRDAEGDTEIVTGVLPMVITAQQGLNEPRYPSLIGIRKASKKPLTHVTVQDLKLSAEDLAGRINVLETYLPKPKEAGRVLSGELTDVVRELAEALHTTEKVV
ncbi:electron transfer flavoprotein beta subunit/FixA family protein [Alicyclobacillaceae bacterium I2511]|nr:electron transfer flavoprotein beta subunit/FixA family protein [Alicyclobacillaceae bacterium I2511]